MEVNKEDIGKLVTYWDNGQRVGYLAAIKKTNGVIRPIAVYKAGKPHLINISLENIERIK